RRRTGGRASKRIEPCNNHHFKLEERAGRRSEIRDRVDSNAARCPRAQSGLEKVNQMPEVRGLKSPAQLPASIFSSLERAYRARVESPAGRKPPRARRRPTMTFRRGGSCATFQPRRVL